MVFNKENIGKSWPWLESQSILHRNSGNISKKGFVIFESGYGPSGLPHLGTFAEVLRTSIVRSAYEELTSHKTKLYVFSDDMDGLRKVPSNLPNQQMLIKNIGKPLSSIPDPFDEYPSLADYNNNKLKGFLNQFEFEYEFISATECYKSGKFNNTLIKFLDNHQKILDLVLPELGTDRRKSYSPFLPICQKTNKVLQTKVISINKEEHEITYLDDNSEEQTTSILNGKAKLQWKADWAMRWVNFDVDYEMAGKDLIPSKSLSSRITKALGHKPPVGFSYEHFLDILGEKISKSRGNGLSMNEWLRYGPTSSLSYFLFQKPKTAKRISFAEIPKAANGFFLELLEYKNLDPKKKVDSPIYHLKNFHKEIINQVSDFSIKIDYNLLLNLATVCRAENSDVLVGFIEKYYTNLNASEKKYLKKISVNIINYYKDFIVSKLNYATPDKQMTEALSDLASKLHEDLSETEIQSLVYDCGKLYGYDSLKDWFRSLYQCLLGQDSGPRFGSFFSIYGIENSKVLINDAILRNK